MSMTLTASGLTFSDSTSITTLSTLANSSFPVGTITIGCVYAPFSYGPAMWWRHGDSISGSYIYVPYGKLAQSVKAFYYYNSSPTSYAMVIGDPSLVTPIGQSGGSNNTSTQEVYLDRGTYPQAEWDPPAQNPSYDGNGDQLPGYTTYNYNNYVPGATSALGGTWRCISAIARHYISNGYDTVYHPYSCWMRIA